MKKVISNIKKQKEAESAIRQEMKQEKITSEDLACQQNPEHVAAHKMLHAALNDKGLRWVSCDAYTHNFYSPALGVNVYLYKVCYKRAYRVRFGNSTQVDVSPEEPAGILACRLYDKGMNAWHDAMNTEQARREYMVANFFQPENPDALIAINNVKSRQVQIVMAGFFCCKNCFFSIHYICIKALVGVAMNLRWLFCKQPLSDEVHSPDYLSARASYYRTLKNPILLQRYKQLRKFMHQYDILLTNICYRGRHNDGKNDIPAHFAYEYFCNSLGLRLYILEITPEYTVNTTFHSKYIICIGTLFRPPFSEYTFVDKCSIELMRVKHIISQTKNMMGVKTTDEAIQKFKQTNMLYLCDMRRNIR